MSTVDFLTSCDSEKELLEMMNQLDNVDPSEYRVEVLQMAIIRGYKEIIDPLWENDDIDGINTMLLHCESKSEKMQMLV